MSRYLIILLYLCIFNSSLADSLKVEASLVTTLDRSFRHLATSIKQYDKDIYHKYDIPKNTHTTAVLVRLNKSMHFGFLLGLQVADKGFRTKIFTSPAYIITPNYTLKREAKYRVDYGFRFYDLIVGFNASTRLGALRAGIDWGFTAGMGKTDKLICFTVNNRQYINYKTNQQVGLSLFAFPRLDLYVTENFALGITGHCRYSPFKFDDNLLLYGWGGGFTATYYFRGSDFEKLRYLN